MFSKYISIQNYKYCIVAMEILEFKFMLILPLLLAILNIIIYELYILFCLILVLN